MGSPGKPQYISPVIITFWSQCSADHSPGGPKWVGSGYASVLEDKTRKMLEWEAENSQMFSLNSWRFSKERYSGISHVNMFYQ